MSKLTKFAKNTLYTYVLIKCNVQWGKNPNKVLMNINTYVIER